MITSSTCFAFHFCIILTERLVQHYFTTFQRELLHLELHCVYQVILTLVYLDARTQIKDRNVSSYILKQLKGTFSSNCNCHHQGAVFHQCVWCCYLNYFALTF